MIPISDIQRVIEKLESSSTIGWGSASDYDHGMTRAYNDAINLLKELIPSEPNSTSE